MAGMLVALLIGLIIALGIILLGSFLIKPDEPDNRVATLPSQKNSLAAKDELEVIKKQLEFFSPEQSVSRLENFLEKYGESSPAEANTRNTGIFSSK